MRSQDFARSDRLSDQIKIEVSEILKEEVKDPRLRGLTVLRVEVSKDIKKAFIYFSSLNSFNDVKIEEILEGLEKARGFIRFSLGKRLSIKRIPEILFERDEFGDRA